MAEFVVNMLKNTPVWVYLLFAFLLYRGIKARTPAKAGKAGARHRPHLFYDREPCYRGKRARLLAGKGLSGRGVSGFPQGSCKTAPVWGIV